MPRRLIAAAVLSCALAGCAVQPRENPVVSAAPVITTTGKVASAIRTVCGLRVAARTIVALVATYRGYTGTADDLVFDLANGVCAAVQESYASTSAPEFRGVRIIMERNAR